MIDIFNEIKSIVSARDVLEKYGQFPTHGNKYKCFAHPDHNPSANIMKKGDKFHCFSCGWTGDIFDIVQFFEKCDKKRAMEIVDNDFHLGLVDKLKVKDKKELKRLKEERDRKIREKKVAEEYEKKLHISIINFNLFWYNINAKCHPKRGEVRNGNWKMNDLFFYSLKQIELGEWLLDVILGGKHDFCEYDVIYGSDKKNIIKMIKNNQIKNFV